MDVKTRVTYKWYQFPLPAGLVIPLYFGFDKGRSDVGGGLTGFLYSSIVVKIDTYVYIILSC